MIYDLRFTIPHGVSMEAETVYRYRLTFSKGRRVKYIGHLDTVTTWTRAFRRAQLPLDYSKGFNPQARIQVAASLPLGYIGQAELMDIFLSAPIAPETLLAAVGNTLPEGFGLHKVEQVELKSPALQSLLRQSDYLITAETDLAKTELQTRIEALLQADEVIQTRVRRKRHERYDLRPLLHQLEAKRISETDIQLAMRLSTGQQGNLRPDAVMQALNLGDIWYEVERLKLIFNI
jgi:radical SAM-linked protein